MTISSIKRNQAKVQEAERENSASLAFLNSPVSNGLAEHDAFNSNVAQLNRLLRFSAAIVIALTGGTSAQSGISIQAPSSVSLPSVEVSPHPVRISSTEQSIILNNTSLETGWRLAGEVFKERAQGDFYGDDIAARLIFKSVRWKSLGIGSAQGIRVSSDKRSVEADPGYGIGQFEITYEIEYTIPAFPYADNYHGVTVFSLQS